MSADQLRADAAEQCEECAELETELQEMRDQLKVAQTIADQYNPLAIDARIYCISMESEQTRLGLLRTLREIRAELDLCHDAPVAQRIRALIATRLQEYGHEN